MSNRIAITTLALATCLALSATVASTALAASDGRPSPREAYAAGRWAPVEDFELLDGGRFRLVLTDATDASVEIVSLPTTRERGVETTGLLIDGERIDFHSWFDELAGEQLYQVDGGEPFTFVDDAVTRAFDRGLVEALDWLEPGFEDLMCEVLRSSGEQAGIGCGGGLAPDADPDARTPSNSVVDTIVRIIKAILGGGTGDDDTDDPETCGGGGADGCSSSGG